MRGQFIRKTVKMIILSVLFSITPLFAQTAIVNAVPGEVEEDSVDYSSDVDSGMMECLFDRGYIIFSQSTDDPIEILVVLGRETGADIIINWSIEEEGLSGSLLNCRTGAVSASQTVTVNEFEDRYRDKHKMYMEMGFALCEQLIPDD